MRRQSDAIGDAQDHGVTEPPGTLATATADKIRNDELGICFNGGPRPDIAGAIDWRLHLCDGTRLRTSGRSNLIDFNPPHVRQARDRAH